MEQFRVRPLTEADFDKIVHAAGGKRAHPDADKRTLPGADYVLGEAILELKLLDDERLAKAEPQAKLARLFREHQPDRPVIVLDRESLPDGAKRAYDRIFEGPIKKEVSTARTQLKQTRAEYPEATTSILVVVNNGYASLDHDALLRMVTRRARNDTTSIDWVVVAGMYFYSDNYETYSLCPMDCLPLDITKAFRYYERLRSAWNDFAEMFMTEVVRGEMPADKTKGPVVDIQFDAEGVTYVLPAPPMGKRSDFFSNGRPRLSTAGLKNHPPGVRAFPDMSRIEWQRVSNGLPEHSGLGSSYEEWIKARTGEADRQDPCNPFVPMRVASDEWLAWCEHNAEAITASSLARFANSLFEQQARMILQSARERPRAGIVPSRYVLVTTEVIGQDKANDVSHIAVVTERISGEPAIRELVTNARIFHEQALRLACAYAVREQIDTVLWQQDLTYAWL